MLAEERVQAGTLPGVAWQLTLGPLAIRAVLEARENVPGTQLLQGGTLTDAILTFRILEVFYWEEYLMARPAPEAGARIAFRTSSHSVDKIEPAVAVDGEYWVMTPSSRPHAGGQFRLGGLFPIRTDCIEIHYTMLKHAAEEHIGREPATLCLPLERYREALRLDPCRGEVFAALWAAEGGKGQ